MPIKTQSRTQLIAHRGNSGPLPENTLAAIESAMALKVDMIEADIRLTSDGTPVLLHHETLHHTTSGTGLVAETTWEELRGLDAGSWRGREFVGQSVPSLEEVLRLTAGRVPLNLDIKTPSAAIPTLDLIQRVGATDEVILSGCTAPCLSRPQNVMNRPAMLLNLDDTLHAVEPCISVVATASLAVATALRVAAINISHTVATGSVVEEAHAAGLGVWVFTVDDPSRFSALLDMGVDSITTNWPERMLPLMTAQEPLPVLSP